MEAIIDIQQLTKKYGDFTAVDQISFDVKKGEIFAFL
jgi:ABC-2 type transport system ATP-binding protein